MVTEIDTLTRSRLASDDRMSMSRTIDRDLVSTVTGWPALSSTSRSWRMIPKRFSIG